MTTDGGRRLHPPSMVAEVLELLRPVLRTGWMVDCTVGNGGHAEAILQASPDVRLLALDKDAESLEVARERLASFADRTLFRHADYAGLRSVAEELDLPPLSACLIDCGPSVWQLDAPERGFSFRFSGPLDARLDRSQPLTAFEVVNRWTPERLTALIEFFGEPPPRARRIVRSIVRRRERSPLRTTDDLVAAIVAGLPQEPRRQKTDRCTKTFLAIRAAVNDELDVVPRGIEAAAALLVPGGRLVVLSWHSAEDGIVKRCFRKLAGQSEPTTRLPIAAPAPQSPVLSILTRRPLRPSAEEARANPRSRSCCLRAAEKL